MFGRDTAESSSDPYGAARQQMIEEQLRRRGVVMHTVLAAMAAIPRHLFIGHEYTDRAYDDEALPSLEGQTISQPYIVGIMTQELALRSGQRVLEIGTGTGYQTALLAEIVGAGGMVYTVERMAALLEAARRRLEVMEIRNVRYALGDGSGGWSGQAWDGPRGAGGVPLFERIMVTAGSPEVPAPLLEQLADGGVMVIPLGNSESQMLMRVERQGAQVRCTELLACRFVPLVGAHAWRPEE